MSIKNALGTVKASALAMSLLAISGCYSDGKWSMPNLAFWKKDAATTPQAPGGVSPPAIGSPVKPSTTAGVASNPAPGAGYNLAGTGVGGSTGASSQYTTPPAYSQPTTGSYATTATSPSTGYGANTASSGTRPTYPGSTSLPAAYNSPSSSTVAGSQSTGNYMSPQTGYYSATPPSSSYSSAPSSYGTTSYGPTSSSQSAGSYGGTPASYGGTGTSTGAAAYTASTSGSAAFRPGSVQPAASYNPAATSGSYANPVRPEASTSARYDRYSTSTTSPATYPPSTCSGNCTSGPSAVSTVGTVVNGGSTTRGSTSSSVSASPYRTTEPLYGGSRAQPSSGTGYTTGSTGSRTGDAAAPSGTAYDYGAPNGRTASGSYGSGGSSYQSSGSSADYSPYVPPSPAAPKETNSAASSGGMPEYRPGSTRNADYPLAPASPYGSSSAATQSAGGGYTLPAASSYR